ncbi:MAG TPA: hypothetical protein PK812_09930 [Beijerinckiaceae bacterium]|nr:hypothetical protein [Beijerinckiaceae bacterium]
MTEARKTTLEFTISPAALTRIVQLRDESAEKLGETGLIPSVAWGFVVSDGKKEHEGFVIGLYPGSMRGEISRILHQVDGVEVAIFLMDEKLAEMHGKTLHFREESGFTLI